MKEVASKNELKSINIEPLTPEENQIYLNAKKLGLIEDEWYRMDGTFRAGAIQQRVREEQKIKFEETIIHQNHWLSSVQNQANIMGNILGFFGVILTILVMFLVDEDAFNLNSCSIIIFTVICVLDYVLIAYAAKKLLDIVNNEREISYKGANATLAEKEKNNKLRDDFYYIFNGILIITGLVFIFGLNIKLFL